MRQKTLETASRILVFLALCFAISEVTLAQDGFFHVYEAERSVIECKAGDQPDGSMWASNGKVTPAFWGQEWGDSVTWKVRLPYAVNNLKIAVRYSYDRNAYVGFTGHENKERKLNFSFNGKDIGQIHVPDTGSWHIFNTVYINMPTLKAGFYEFGLSSPAMWTCTNLDCFIFYEDSTEEKISPAMRNTIIAVSDNNHFVIRATAGVKLNWNTEKIFRDFDRIYAHYADYMGWEPPTPVGINVIENAVWPDPGATSFQNNYGVHFYESAFYTDFGNWCHEMTHMFYVAHFPWWFDESSVRTLTTFNWVPDLFPQHTRPEDNPYYRQCMERGRDVLANPDKKFGGIDEIHYAIRVKYGPEVFKKFFHLCKEAGEKGQIDFTPGRHLNKEQIAGFMSLAAGEDVRPLYRQWTDYRNHE